MLKITPDTRITAPVVIVNYHGTYKLHRKDCNRIKRQLERAGGVHYLWDDFEGHDTLGAYALYSFGDIASDEHEEGTPEHAAAAWQEMRTDLEVERCAHGCLA